MLEWEEYFEPQILDRGRSYARRGAVKHIKKQGDVIEAVVEGSEYYKVKFRYDGQHFLDSYCSCPYASGGFLCKHMAAVLCVVDTGMDELSAEAGEWPVPDIPENDVVSIADLLGEAERSQLESILLDLAHSDDKIESRIRILLAGVSAHSDLTNLKNEIDSIFDSYSGYGNYIDYHGAIQFADDLTTYLENVTARLFDDGDSYEAFELSIYAFVKLGNCDIDDDGEISMISNCCYRIWQKTIQNCTDAELGLIREWFLDHSDDGTVFDYMEEVLQEFLRYELATKEELLEEIRYLDNLIEESRESNKCKSVFTCFYGYHIEAVEFRMILMKRLGASEKEIDDFRRQNMCFQSVRAYYIKMAQTKGNTEEEIRLLEESKKMDADAPHLVNAYSKRLIEIFHERGDYAREMEERKNAFLSYQLSTIDDFRRCRDMYSKEAWSEERKELIKSRHDAAKRCELLAEEKMLPELFDEISKQKNKLSLYNKYGFLLADDYSEPILQEYCSYVSSVADYARNRAHYDELIRYLMRMKQYAGGREMVRNLCGEWISKYPTRKVMVQELRRMM